MRGVMLAFLMWLFRLWTWLKAFISLAWWRVPPSDPGTAGTRVGLEVQSSKELEAFLSSLPDVTRFYYKYNEAGFHLEAQFSGGDDYEKRVFSGNEVAHREFLAAVASSRVGCCEAFTVSVTGGDTWQHLEEVIGALKSNNSFKSVELDYRNCSLLRVSERVSNMLLQNSTVQTLSLSIFDTDYHLQVIGKEAAEQLAKALQKNRALQSLDLWGIIGGVDEEGLKVLMEPLKSPLSVLQSLRFGTVTDGGLEHVGAMLVTNTSLKRLTIHRGRQSNDEVCMRGYTSLRDALLINQTLEELKCSTWSSMELKLLLEPLMPTKNMPQVNSTLTSLTLGYRSRIGGKEGMDILVDMIRTNSSLLEVRFQRMRELNAPHDAVENVVIILEALKANQSLKKVDLSYCDGVGGYKVLGTMMDMLLENHHLIDIDLGNTPLDGTGDAEYVYSALKKRKKMELWKLVQGMAKEDPKSGRVFLCGNPYAGKTTLRKAIKRLPDFQSKKKGAWFKSKIQGKPKSNVIVNDRTHGIEVDHVTCEGIGISIWDMAGQTDYHSFHDLVIPNLSADGSCSIFLLTCNPMKGSSNDVRNISDIRSEIEYWLRFIASNTRRSWSYRPHVSIVMTHFDYWNNAVELASCIEKEVQKLKVLFEEVLEFDQDRNVFKVNGCREDVLDAKVVFGFTKAHFKQLLRRLPKIIKACSKVQWRVEEWNLNKGIQKLPLLKWEDFSNIICKGVDELDDANEELAQRKKEFVATSLHDGGHILYHEEGKFVITNPHWFCHDIIGEFLHCCANMKPELEKFVNGMIEVEFVKEILSRIIGHHEHDDLLDEILSIMKKLHICYEKDANNIMIPSTLRDDKYQGLKWPTRREISKPTFIGRRLVCKDEIRTMFSPGFFTRLQVSFFNKFQNNNVGNSYELSQDVVKFICDGIEVIIEFNHLNIDILLKSNQCQEVQDKMLEFLENGIVMPIKDLLSNSTLGCPGVILVEHVLRPECVQELVNSKDRKNQYVSLEELEIAIAVKGFDAKHNWKSSGKLGTGCDKVKDLLGEKEWKTLLEKHYKNLERFHQAMLCKFPLQESNIANEKTNHITTSLYQLGQKISNDILKHLRALLWKDVYEKLDRNYEATRNVDKKVDVVIHQLHDVIQLQESIKILQCNLIHEVSSKIDNLMGFTMSMQNSQVPKLAYLTEVHKESRLTHFIPGVMKFELHLMCESRDGIHEVTNQQGCEVKFVAHEMRTFMTILWWGMKIATILAKIGAHVAGGMGAMVPDFGEVLQSTGLVLDTPDLLKEDMFCSNQESLPDDLKSNPRITIDDSSKAQEWLIDFLEPKCKKDSTFFQMFKLKKVVYKATDKRGPSAWLCDECRTKATQRGILVDY